MSHLLKPSRKPRSLLMDRDITEPLAPLRGYKPKLKAYKNLSKKDLEFLELIRQGKNDPVFFAEKILGLVLHDKQKFWLWMTTKTQREKAFNLGLSLGFWKDRNDFNALLQKNPTFSRNILVPSNRWGKTLITSIKHIWYNFYKKGVRGGPGEKAIFYCGTLNLSPHSDQLSAGYQYIVDILSSKFVYTINGITQKNQCLINDFLIGENKIKRKLIFNNNTFYKAVPTGEDRAASLAGNPYLYISYDECALSLHLQQELPSRIMSRLIDFGGALDLVSTPDVDSPSHQYFFHIAKLGLKCEEGWWTLVGSIKDNIFLSPEEIKKISQSIKSVDPAKYRQVIYGEFITTGKKMFDSLCIERLWDKKEPELPQVGHRYLISVDWGFADTGDPTVFYVIDYTSYPYYRISYREAIRGGSPFEVITRARILQREWLGALFIHDASSLGGVIIKKLLQEVEMQNIINVDFSGTQKMDMLFALQTVLTANRHTEINSEGKIIEKNPDFGRLRSYHIPELETQLGNYQYNPQKGISDRKLEQDDVIALAMGIWYLEKKLRSSQVQKIDFNPLAPTRDLLFTNDQNSIKIKNIVIDEKRIF